MRKLLFLAALLAICARSGWAETADVKDSSSTAAHDEDVRIAWRWYRQFSRTHLDTISQRLEDWVKAHPTDGESMFLLSRLYLPRAIRNDVEASGRMVQLLKAAADLGYPPAMATLGAVMINGKKVPKDLEEGMKLLRAAVATDDPDAHAAYGVVSIYMLKGKPDGYAAAIAHLKRAADAGLNDVWAPMWLAYCLQGQCGEHLDLLRKGAEAGDPFAQLYLSQCYRTGELVLIDLKEAERWGKLAVEDGNPDAQLSLGELYGEMAKSSPDALAQSQHWLELASEGGNMKARYWVGLACINQVGLGNGDREKGLRLLREAAEGGIPEAAFDLGEQYFSGALVERDLKEARRWFEIARKNGHPGADNDLRWIDFAERREAAEPAHK